MARRFDAFTPALSESTLGVLAKMGFATATPVQSAVIPLFMGNKDVCVEACTGSGKTIAFVVPVVERLLRLETRLEPNQVGGIVISPTRELARQTYEVFRSFTGALPGVRPALVVGGTDVTTDIDRAQRRGANILIATPGRLLDVFRRACGLGGGPVLLDTKTVEVLVLDEADTLLDMGFQETLTQILGHLPKQRRTGLFSATQTNEVRALARAGLRNPALVSVKVQMGGSGSGGAAAAAAKPAAAASAAAAGGAAGVAAGSSSKASDRPPAAKRARVEEELEDDDEAGEEDGEEEEEEEEEEAGGDDDDEDVKEKDSGAGSDDDEEGEEEDDEAAGGGPASPLEAAAAAASAAASAAAAAASAGGSQSTPLSLTNHVMTCASPQDKLAQLLVFLRRCAAAGEKVIAFVLTCASVDYYGKALEDAAVRAAARLPSQADFPILPLHGQMAPKARVRNYSAFVGAASACLLCTDVAARGIDVPDVSWIVQFDPPKDPAFFIHRVGRTARAGKRGQSLLLLLPKEEGYVPLLEVKRVPIAPMERAPTVVVPDPPRQRRAHAAGAEAAGDAGAADADGAAAAGDESTAAATAAAEAAAAAAAAAAADPDAPLNISAVCDRMRDAAVADRDILEKATKAFVSYVRGYSEHTFKYIFKLKHLDVTSLAHAFGLVKLPKVEELRGQRFDYVGRPDVDTSTVAYRDPKREHQRQAKLIADAEKDAAERAARDARRAKVLAEAESGVSGKKRKRSHASYSKKVMEDWDVLQKEERLEKRLRQGKISKADYKREIMALNRAAGMGIDAAGLGLEDEDDMSGLMAMHGGGREVDDGDIVLGDDRGHVSSDDERDDAAGAGSTPPAVGGAGTGDAAAASGKGRAAKQAAALVGRSKSAAKKGGPRSDKGRVGVAGLSKFMS